VLGNIFKHRIVLVGVVDTLGVTLDIDGAQHFVIHLQRRANAVHIHRACQHNFARVNQLRELLHAVLDGFAAANHIAGHTVKLIQGRRRERLIMLIDEIRKTQQACLFIMERDEKISGVHQLPNGLMDAGVKGWQILAGVGGIRNFE